MLHTYYKFQPTRPLRGATTPTVSVGASVKFQPTRPLRGATYEIDEHYYEAQISTHAPLAGRDGKFCTNI